MPRRGWGSVKPGTCKQLPGSKDSNGKFTRSDGTRMFCFEIVTNLSQEVRMLENVALVGT